MVKELDSNHLTSGACLSSGFARARSNRASDAMNFFAFFILQSSGFSGLPRVYYKKHI